MTPPFFMSEKEQELTAVLQVYIKRLTDETQKCIAYEARINSLIEVQQKLVEKIQELQDTNPGSAKTTKK